MAPSRYRTTSTAWPVILLFTYQCPCEVQQLSICPSKLWWWFAVPDSGGRSRLSARVAAAFISYFMALLHSLYFSIHYNTQVYQVTSHLDYNNCFAFISSCYNSFYKFPFTCNCLLYKILIAVLDIVICLTFLSVRTYTYCVMALSVSIVSTKFHLFFKIIIQTKL